MTWIAFALGAWLILGALVGWVVGKAIAANDEPENVFWGDFETKTWQPDGRRTGGRS